MYQRLVHRAHPVIYLEQKCAPSTEAKMNAMIVVMQNNKQKLERNIKLFGFYKIFTKRVFLPLTTIYASQQAGLNIQQIGIIAALSSLVGLLSDAPTGYWADNHGRKRSSQTGALLAAFGTLTYVLSNNFWGILIAGLVTSLGYSFLFGSMEALIHDSLVILKREHEYSKLASRAQSMGLVANAFFVATIPLLYPIDKRLPFVAGFLAYMALFGIASMLQEPHIDFSDLPRATSFKKTVRLFINRNTVLFFVCVGIVLAAGTSTTDISNLAFIQLGMRVKYMGIMFGVASLLGAVVGLFIHHLKKLPFMAFATIDLLFSALPFFAFGYIRTLSSAIIALILCMSMWRFEQILYQHYILEQYGTTRYKATILSLLTNSRSLNEVWMTIAATAAAKHFGLLDAMGYFGIAILLFLPLLLMSIKMFITFMHAKSASLNH